MTNIFKSYIKLFIKSWIETLGTVLFLAIFTMVIMGMLATPLQLTLKAASIEGKTNTWDRQMQFNSVVSEESIEKIWNEKDIEINYEGAENFVIETKGWLQEEAKQNIIASAQYQAELELNNSGTDQGEDIKEELIKSYELKTLSSILATSRRGGIDAHYSFPMEGDNKEVKYSDIFSQSLIEDFVKYNAGGSFVSYISNRLLEQVEQNEKDFRYNVFQRLVSRFQDVSNSTEVKVQIESLNAVQKSSNDANLNNLIVEKGQNKIDPYTINTTVYDAYVNDLFLKSRNLKIGNTLTIAVSGARIQFRIVGEAIKYSTLTPSNSGIFESNKNYAQIFVDSSFFNQQIFDINFKTDFKFDSNTYIIQDRMIKNSKYDMNDLFYNFFSRRTLPFKTMKHHEQIAQLENLRIMTWIFGVIGGILFVLGFFFVLFVIKKEIRDTRRQLGVFKSLGYTTRELTWVFAVKTMIVMTISIAIGYALSIPFQIKAATKTYANIVIFDYQSIYSNPIFLTLLIIGVPLLFSAISYMTIFRYMNESALDLLSKGPKQKTFKHLNKIIYVIFPPALIFAGINYALLSYFRKRNIAFTYRMQDAFVSHGKGKFFLIMGLIGLSSYLFTMQMRALPVINNMINGAFNYFSEDMNHYYHLQGTSNIAVWNKITLDERSYKKRIKWFDISEYGTVENFLQNSDDAKSFNKYLEINKLMTKLSETRDDLARRELITQENSTYASMVFNALALFTPFENIDDIPTNINDLNMTTLQQLLKIIEPDSENTMYAVKNDKTEEFNSIWLSDIAKYSCISSASSSFTNCSDPQEYQKYLLGQVNIDSSNPNDGNNNNEEEGETGGTSALNTGLATFLAEIVIKDFSTDQFITSNSALFDKNTDLLTYNVPAAEKNSSELDPESTYIISFDTTGKYGSPRNTYNFDGITNEQFDKLREELPGQEIPGLVSARVQRLLNLKIGDVIPLNVGVEGRMSIDLKVVGINKNDNMMENFYLDYNNLFDKFGDKEKLDPNENYFNAKYSTKPSIDGEFNINDLENLGKNFKNRLETSAVQTSNILGGTEAKEWLGPMLDVYWKEIVGSEQWENLGELLEAFLGDKKQQLENALKSVDKEFNYIMDGNVLGGNIVVLPIIKSAINSMMEEMSRTMLMYIAIDVMLLIILLVVIMNIIISDAISIITIMRSLGYTDKKINWMVIGRYVTGSLFAFITAYGLSMITWAVIRLIVWNKLKVLLVIPVLPWIPIVSFISIAAIMFIGWVSAIIQIKKRALTEY
ncbi:ABC transporter permease [Spiroplasma chinense]|uniref:ABC transporter permease n=1 Tax=Spiroplasma chinense TaxID=216932 RepID=A0A5B9Y502_9MOLU|nr:ABC transporter permease [Spiroplasma chinense]QEH62174.1 ABC transporter permease [Spiroplasma chinense]